MWEETVLFEKKKKNRQCRGVLLYRVGVWPCYLLQVLIKDGAPPQVRLPTSGYSNTF